MNPTELLEPRNTGEMRAISRHNSQELRALLEACGVPDEEEKEPESEKKDDSLESEESVAPTKPR